jgi:sulfite reductase (NADPH) flavoprotein alpha-component
MSWKAIHRWLGLSLGTVALVLGLSGALLALDPVQEAWQAPAAPAGLPVATLVQQVHSAMPGVEEIRRLPSGAVAAFGFVSERAQARYVDPATGQLLGNYQPSSMPRWVKNLHRALLLGDGGRWGSAATALSMAVLSISGLVLLLRRMGSWRHLAGHVRGTLAQRLHVLAGRVVLALLLLSALTALTKSASTLGLVEPEPETDVVSSIGAGADLAPAQLLLLRDLPMRELRRVNWPDANDPTDTWQVATTRGQGWIDRHSGATLAWQEATLARRLEHWARVLHTGESAWPWAVVMGLSGLSVLLFWLSGVLIWWQGRRNAVHIANNSRLQNADVLIFVASEGGSTWGFAQALHAALVRAGRRVHSSALESFQVTPAAQQVFILAATHGDGQPPAHARHAMERIAAQGRNSVPVTVQGFGDRQYPAFCAYAQAVNQALRAKGHPALLPLETIHQQSAQQFARWGEALAQALGQRLAIDYQPRLPATTALTLIERRDYPGQADRPTVILRFAWPRQPRHARLLGRGLGSFEAGDLMGIVAPSSTVARYYSLASGSADGFLEICVRQWPGGVCSTYLRGLKPGDNIQAFIRANPGFALSGRHPSVLLIGAGTGVAPLAGFIRRNDERTPMYLYFGARDPATDYYFGPEIERWLVERRVSSVRASFSRVPGGSYVQEALRRDGERLRGLLAAGATVRVCGSRPMAKGVTEVLDSLLGPLGLSVNVLKARGRYAEDLF